MSLLPVNQLTTPPLLGSDDANSDNAVPTVADSTIASVFIPDIE
jgi:hypothetical protein